MNNRAALVFSRSVRALIQSMALQAMNMQRSAVGASMAYIDEDFFSLIEENQLTEREIREVLGLVDDSMLAAVRGETTEAKP